MTIAISSIGSGRLAIDITGVASIAAAGQGSLANPEGCSIHIVRAHLLTKVAAIAASAALSIGVTTVAASDTDVLNALDVNAATVDTITDCHNVAGAETKLVPTVWTADKYLTFSGSVASMVGFTGTLFLEYLRTPPE